MRSRALGQSGIQASVVGLGTWAIGGWMWGGTDAGQAVGAIQAGIDAGVNLIDTAPIYGFGLSEEIVGQAIVGRRDKVVLATKCGLVWEGEKGQLFFMTDEKHPVREASAATRTVYRYLGPESIRREVEASLRRLRVETIDLYQTHWQDPTTPITDTMACLLKLKEQGKIRALGVSNATADQIEQYRRVGPLDSDQEPYSMLDREIESEVLPCCRRGGLAMLAYSPLARGLLTGKIGPDRRFAEGDQRAGNPRFSPENLAKIEQMLREFQPIASAHGLTPAQLAIAWTIAQPGCTHALCGARNAAQAVENAQAGEAVLSQQDLAAMNAAIARHAS